MGNENKTNYENNIFYGSVQNVNGNVANYFGNTDNIPCPSYSVEPIWRSPVTLGILTWASAIISLLSILPLKPIILMIYYLIARGKIDFGEEIPVEKIILFVVFVSLSLLLWKMRSIAKKQLRKPLFGGLAVSGLGEKITIERVKCKCPICNAKMKYYNKPSEWIDSTDAEGRIKREIIKRAPALECKRNGEHCWWVDPATGRCYPAE